MSATVLYMSMSLDGFIAGPNERTASATAGNACTTGCGRVMNPAARQESQAVRPV